MTFLGWSSDPFKWLSDLQIGDEKVTLNHRDTVDERNPNIQLRLVVDPIIFSRF